MKKLVAFLTLVFVAVLVVNIAAYAAPGQQPQRLKRNEAGNRMAVRPNGESSPMLDDGRQQLRIDNGARYAGNCYSRHEEVRR